MAGGRPDLCGAALPPPFGRLEGEHAQQRVDRLGRDLTDKRQSQHVAVVQHGGGFADAPLSGVGFGRLDHQRLGRNPDREHRAERRLLDGRAQSLDGGADRRVFGWVERPVSSPDKQRSCQLLKAARELG